MKHKKMMNKKCPWCDSDKTQMHLWVKDLFLTQEAFEIHECLKCGLLFTEPRPKPEEIGKYYQSDEYYSHKENKKGFIPRIYESVKKVNLKRKVRMATKGLPTGKMLEIGCGVGDFIKEMEHKGWDCTGIEPSIDAKAIAQKRIKARLYDPTEINTLPDESFDLISMWHVLEHVDDLKEEIRQLQRLLKKGGRLVLALPNFKSYDAQYYKEYWAAYDVPRHLNHFSRETINTIFKNSGFVLKKTDKLIWDAYYISFMSEKYKNHRLPLMKGVFRGWVSNCKARKTSEWSSLVYFLECLK